MTTFVLIAVAVLLIYGALPRPAPGGSGRTITYPSSPVEAGRGTLRLATYNIYGGKGEDGTRDLERAATVLGDVDIVALQEVRGGHMDNQARRLGQRLDMGWLFITTRRRWYRGDRGNGLLCRFPVIQWDTFRLLPFSGRARFRNYTVVRVQLAGRTLSLLITHLHTRDGREGQLETVLQRFQALPAPAVLLGDLNTRPDDPIIERFSGDACRDAIREVLGTVDDPERVDWILYKGLRVTGGGMTEQGVSDHPYYWIEVETGVSPQFSLKKLGSDPGF